MARKSRAKYDNDAARHQAQHYGYPDVNSLTVGSRFFFFNSLATDDCPYGIQVYNKAHSILNEHSAEIRLKNVNEDGEEKINEALSFLRRAVEYERAHERRIWKDRVLNILAGTEYEAMAQKCFPENSNSINYLDFINILGLIETDAHNKTEWTRDIDQLLMEILQFNNEVSQVNNNINASNEVLNKYGPGRFIQRIYKNGYGDRRQMSAFTFSMIKTPQLNRALLGSKRSPFFSNILPDMKIVVQSLIDSSTNKIEFSVDQQLGFMSEVAHSMLEEFYNTLVADDSTIKNLNSISYNDFEDLFFTTKANGTKEVRPEELEKLKSVGEKLLKNMKLLEEEGKSIRETPTERLKIRETKKGNKIIGLNKNTRERLINIIKELDEQSKFAKDYQNQKLVTKSSREEFWQRLKKELFPLMQRENPLRKKFFNKEYVDFINELLSQTSKFTIYDNTEYHGAHALHEIFASSEFKEDIAIKVIGQALGKTDVSGLIIPLGKITADYSMNQDSFAQKFLNKFETDYDSFYQEQRNIVSQATNQFTQTNSFSTVAQHIALKQAHEQLHQGLESELKELIAESNDEESAKQISEILKNILIIDESTKFSEKYFEDYGFKGGSLGANVDEQIDNICAIFELGGITHIDRDWLVFATLNSGNALIGHDLRPSLEDYFSTVASLLMFRSGGVLAEQIKSGLEEKVRDDDYIRIYRLGPLFVPNSYILQLTYDALNDANNQIYRSAYGSRAMIHNNVNAPVGKKKINSETNKVTSVWQWAETYSVNYPRVQINIQILGGFLDILEKLQERLNQF